VSDTSKSAIEDGPVFYEDEDVCWECGGAGEMRNDFGEEWTCGACDGSGVIRL